MEQLQSFSPGLLYSVAPENFSALHLHDEAEIDKFEWDEYESQFESESFAQAIRSFLRITTDKWKIGKP